MCIKLRYYSKASKNANEKVRSLKFIQIKTNLSMIFVDGRAIKAIYVKHRDNKNINNKMYNKQTKSSSLRPPVLKRES